MKKPEIKRNEKLTNGGVLSLYNKLSNVKGLKGIKLLYAVDKSKRALKPIVDALSPDKLIPKPEAFLNYEKEVKEKANALRDKLFAENPQHPSLVIAENGRSELLYSSPDAQELIGLLSETHRETIAQYQKDIDEYNAFLEEECIEDITLHYIELINAPEEQEQFEAVADLIKEE